MQAILSENEDSNCEEIDGKREDIDELEIDVKEEEEEEEYIEEDFQTKLRKLKKWLKQRIEALWQDPLTRSFSYLRVLQTSFYFLLFIFLLNALVVTLAFWKAGTLSLEHVEFELIKLTGLDSDITTLDVSGELKDTFLMNYIQFRLTKPLITKLSLETYSNPDSNPSIFPLITFTIPEGELIDSATRKFCIKNIEIIFEERFPMAAFSNMLSTENLSAELKDILAQLPTISVSMDFGVSTRAFWIPVWFTSVQKFSIDLAKESAAFFKASNESSDNLIPSGFRFTEIDFIQRDDKFEMLGKLSVPSSVFHKYLYIDLPSLNWEARQKTLTTEAQNNTNTEEALRYSGSHRMLSLNIPKQVLDGSFNKSSTSIIFKIALNENDRRGIFECLSAVRDSHLNDLIISLAYNSNASLSCKGLCYWLAPFEIDVPVAPILNSIDLIKRKNDVKIPTRNSFINFDFKGVAENKIGKIGSVAVFSFAASIDLSFLSIKDFNLFEIFKTPLPPFKTSLQLDQGNRNPETLLSINLKHNFSSRLESQQLNFDILIELNDLPLIARAVTETQATFITGSSDTFLSSLLLDPLAIELNSFRFRLGKRLLIKDVFKEKLLYKATAAKNNFSHVFNHKMSISTVSNNSEVSVKTILNFAECPNVNLPFVKISWSETSFNLSSTDNNKIFNAELFRFELSKGNCRFYLKPEKNPYLLIHDGFLDFKVKVKSSIDKQDNFLRSWMLFVRNLIAPDSEDFVPFVFSGQTGNSSFKVPAALPTASILIPLLNQASSDTSNIPENWLNWFKSLSETTVKVSGMRGMTTQLLIEVPIMEICSIPRNSDSYAIDLRLEMASLDLNICRRNQKSGIIYYFCDVSYLFLFIKIFMI